MIRRRSSGIKSFHIDIKLIEFIVQLHLEEKKNENLLLKFTLYHQLKAAQDIGLVDRFVLNQDTIKGHFEALILYIIHSVNKDK